MAIALLLSALFFGLIVIYCAARERLTFYHPLSVLFIWHFLGYILIPWKMLINQDFGYLLVYEIPLHYDYYLVKTIVLLTIGLLCVILGYYSKIGRYLCSKVMFRPRFINPNAVLIISFIAIPIITYSIFTYHVVPGLTKMANRAMSLNKYGLTVYTEASAYVVMSYYLFCSIGLLWFLMAWERGGLWNWLFWPVIAGYLFFTVSRGFHRASWVLLLFGLISLWLILKRRNWPPLKVVVWVIPLLIIFNISAIDRQAWLKIIEERQSAQEYMEEATKIVADSVAQKSDISNFEYNVLLVYLYPEKVPYEYGRNYFNEWLVSALPRVIFTDKDDYKITTNIAKTSDLMNTFGPCSGLYIDFYQNFGIIGMILGCGLFGIALRLIWQMVLTYGSTGNNNYSYIILLYAGIISYLPELLRNGIVTLVSGYFFHLTPILIVIFFSNRIAETSSDFPGAKLNNLYR